MRQHLAVCSAVVLALAVAVGAQVPLKNVEFKRRPADRVKPVFQDQPNIVLIILDDVGVDKVAAYAEGPVGVAPPCTPNMDDLARNGVLFRNAYANPVCSPTRATIMTGRHAFRTGLGLAIVHSTSTLGLSTQYETILPQVLEGYDTSAVGKWHLSARDEALGVGQGLQHPLNAGFGFYAGSMFNLSADPIPCGAGCTPPACVGPFDYSNWVKASDPLDTGVLQQSCTTKYATTDTVDDAIDRAQVMKAPWFLSVAFNAAHVPIHDPPASLCHPNGTCSTQYCPSSPTQTLPERFNAVVEAMDTEIGRLLTGIYQVDPNAFVIMVGDNGTAVGAAQGAPGGCWDPGRAKGTFYEGGINVPLVVAGPGIKSRESLALVNTTDLFATIAGLAGFSVTAEDSVSIIPHLYGIGGATRELVYTEGFFPNQYSPDNPATPPFFPAAHIRTVQNKRFKLIRLTDLTGYIEEEFFDLVTDPCELNDLCTGIGACDTPTLTPDEQLNYNRLAAEFVRLGVN